MQTKLLMSDNQAARLPNNQGLKHIIAILGAGWTVILDSAHPLFHNPEILAALTDYPASYSVDTKWTYSPKLVDVELDERLF